MQYLLLFGFDGSSQNSFGGVTRVFIHAPREMLVGVSVLHVPHFQRSHDVPCYTFVQFQAFEEKDFIIIRRKKRLEKKKGEETNSAKIVFVLWTTLTPLQKTELCGRYWLIVRHNYSQVYGIFTGPDKMSHSS